MTDTYNDLSAALMAGAGGGLGWNYMYPTQEPLSRWYGVGQLPIPKYFETPPMGFNQLSPLALQWLSQLFGGMEKEYGNVWGGQYSFPRTNLGQGGTVPVASTNQVLPWQIKEYKTKEATPEITGGQMYSSEFGPAGTANPIMQPAQPAETEFTAAVQPETPSAQLYRRMQESGALPLMQSYVQDILGQDFTNQMLPMWQAYWPSKQRASPSWRTPKR